MLAIPPIMAQGGMDNNQRENGSYIEDEFQNIFLKSMELFPPNRENEFHLPSSAEHIRAGVGLLPITAQEETSEIATEAPIPVARTLPEIYADITSKESERDALVDELFNKAEAFPFGLGNAARREEIRDALEILQGELDGFYTERNELKESETYIEDNWGRWIELAQLDRALTDAEKAEARDAVKALNRANRWQFPSSYEEVQRMFNYEAVENSLRAKSNVLDAFTFGLVDSIPFFSRAHKAFSQTEFMQDSYKEMYPDEEIFNIWNESLFDSAKENNTSSYYVGNAIGNIALLVLTNGAVQGFTGGISALSNLPTWAQGAVNAGITYGLIGTAQAADDFVTEDQWNEMQEEQAALADIIDEIYIPEPYSPWEQVLTVLKKGGVSALSGAAGGALGGLAGNAATSFLAKHGLSQNSLAQALASGIYGAAFATGSTGVKELATFLEYPEEYEPDVEQITQDVLVAFAFGAISHIIQTVANDNFTMGKDPVLDSNVRPQTEFFKDIDSHEDLQAAYRSLAKQYHPDIGGDVNTMARINNEYDIMKAWFVSNSVSNAAAAYRDATTATGAEQQAAAETFVRETSNILIAVQDGSITGTGAEEAVQILDAIANTGFIGASVSDTSQGQPLSLFPIEPAGTNDDTGLILQLPEMQIDPDTGLYILPEIDLSRLSPEQQQRFLQRQEEINALIEQEKYTRLMNIARAHMGTGLNATNTNKNHRVMLDAALRNSAENLYDTGDGANITIGGGIPLEWQAYVDYGVEGVLGTVEGAETHSLSRDPNSFMPREGESLSDYMQRMEIPQTFSEQDMQFMDDIGLQMQSRGQGEVGNFLNVEGIDDFISRVPPNAVELPWKYIEGGAVEGVKYCWTDDDGNVWNVRAHSIDPRAPIGSNASIGWVYRVEVRWGGTGKIYFMDSSGNFHPWKALYPKSSLYNEEIANDTHIVLGGN